MTNTHCRLHLKTKPYVKAKVIVKRLRGNHNINNVHSKYL